MKKSLCVLTVLLCISACTSVPRSAPLAVPTRLSPVVTSAPAGTVFAPTVTPPSSASVSDLLVQQLNKDLSAYPRPVCEAGTHNEKDWSNYEQSLAPALGRLFSDSRGQSLSPLSLVSIFGQGSGLSLDAVESSTDAVLVTIIKANCNNRTGGGSSPAAPRDTVLVINRHGGIWQIAKVANVLSAAWAVDRWITLITATDFGGGASFEIWNVAQSAGQWKSETKFQFTQSASLPPPRLSGDGSTLTLYSPPAACNLSKNIPDSNSIVESDYRLQNGQYQCIASRVVPTPIHKSSP